MPLEITNFIKYNVNKLSVVALILVSQEVLNLTYPTLQKPSNDVASCPQLIRFKDVSMLPLMLTFL